MRRFGINWQHVRAIACILLVAFAVTPVVAAEGSDDARAVYWWQYTITVPAGMTPNDFHVLFSGTGGTIANVTVVPAGVVTIPGGNMINVVWAANLAAGTVVTITFSTEHPTIAVVGASWTKDGVDIGNPIPPGDEDSFEEIEEPAPIPTVSQWGLIVMTLLLLTGGTILLGRRRRLAAA